MSETSSPYPYYNNHFIRISSLKCHVTLLYTTLLQYFTLHYFNIFVESTPVGRLIQRFSKDLDQIDQQLPTSLGQVKRHFEVA